MEIYKGEMCCAGAELLSTGVMSMAMYRFLHSNGTLRVLRRGCKGTTAMVAVASLPQRYRDALMSMQNDPRSDDMRAREVAERVGYRVERDDVAERFYMDYMVDGKRLGQKSITEYVNGARVLNAVINRLGERIAMKRRLGGSMKGLRSEEVEHYLRYADALDEQYPNQLPKSRRIVDVLGAYAHGWAGGLAVGVNYEALVKNYHGGANAQKITGDAANWILARYATIIDKLNVPQLLVAYNAEAKNRGWSAIQSEKTLRAYLNQNEIKAQCNAIRLGELKAKELVMRQHRTLLPTMRDSLWYSDGTKMNYYYMDENGAIQTCCVYEVVDAFSEVLLGYHISKSENYEAQYMAFKMAIETARHRPYEVKFDNQGGHKKADAQSFLMSLAKICTTTAPYNGRSKTIENVFSRLQQMYMHRDWFFTGQNVTARKEESGVNKESILANKANLPTLEQVKLVYAKRRAEWNNAPHPATGIPRLQMYMQSVNEHAPELSVMQIIDMLWLTTEAKYRTSGLEIRVGGVKYAYEVKTNDGMPDMAFLRKYNGVQFVVKYDPSDMSKIALFERASGGLRMVDFAEPYQMVHRGAQEQTAEDKVFIREMGEQNKVARIDNLASVTEAMNKHNMSPEQHGLRTPNIAGVNSKKVRRPKSAEQSKYNSIGMWQKAESNMPTPDISGMI